MGDDSTSVGAVVVTGAGTYAGEQVVHAAGPGIPEEAVDVDDEGRTVLQDERDDHSVVIQDEATVLGPEKAQAEQAFGQSPLMESLDSRGR